MNLFKELKGNLVLVVIAFALALVPLRASSQASVGYHNRWVLEWWLPSIALLALAVMRKWPGRGVVLLAASLLYFVVPGSSRLR